MWLSNSLFNQVVGMEHGGTCFGSPVVHMMENSTYYYNEDDACGI